VALADSFNIEIESDLATMLLRIPAEARPPKAVETLRGSPGVAVRKGGGDRGNPGTTFTGPTHWRNTGPWRVALGF
jgi:hypothetical protein